VNPDLLLLFVLGLAVGSFLTVVVDRFDTAESFWVGRSHCNHCKKELSWWELLPVAGYLIVKGKCVQCKKIIPHIYPLFEIITGLAFAGVWLAASRPLNYALLAIELLFVCFLLMLAFYDWIHRSFPVVFLYCALGAVVFVILIRVLTNSSITNAVSVTDPIFFWLSSPSDTIISSLKGGIVGAVLLGLLAFPSKGKWMGYGDVLLAGVLGLWLGYPFILMCLMLAFYGGAVIGIWMLYVKRVKDHRIAFGPFLIASSLVSQVWGQGLFWAIMHLWGVV
jgi:prepilin signal peptidase PulO-like enzyme (type II secretory pathway)